jgi:hypothetical protein
MSSVPLNLFICGMQCTEVVTLYTELLPLYPLYKYHMVKYHATKVIVAAILLETHGVNTKTKGNSCHHSVRNLLSSRLLTETYRLEYK